MLADALGRPIRIIVTAGQVGDVTQAPALLDDRTGGAVLADKAYDSNALRALIARRFATRYDRRTIHLTGFVHLAAAMIWLR